jgi:hypothetical protein
LAASRSFASRIFHLPSSAIKKHPHPTLEGLKENSGNGQNGVFPYSFNPQRPSAEGQQGDVVLYPIVGFRFCQGSEGPIRALPTKSNAACRLPANRHEELFGWFSPACKLDLYSEDVCHAPHEGELGRQ